MMHNSTFDDRSPTNPSKKQLFDEIYTGETPEENPSKNLLTVVCKKVHNISFLDLKWQFSEGQE